MIFRWFECGGVVVIDLGLSIGEVCGGRQLWFDQRWRAARRLQKEIGKVCVEESDGGGEICNVGGDIIQRFLIFILFCM